MLYFKNRKTRRNLKPEGREPSFNLYPLKPGPF